MTNEVCLGCEGIERYLGEGAERVHALRGVSLDLEPATVHAVVGPSGCGKSTFSTSLACSIRPIAGSRRSNRKPSSPTCSDDELSRKRNELLGFIFPVPFSPRGFYRAGKRHDPDAAARSPDGRGDESAGGESARGSWSRRISFRARAVISPAANSSAWPWRARWRTIRASSWRMSPRAISTPQIPSAPFELVAADSCRARAQSACFS